VNTRIVAKDASNPHKLGTCFGGAQGNGAPAVASPPNLHRKATSVLFKFTSRTSDSFMTETKQHEFSKLRGQLLIYIDSSIYHIHQYYLRPRETKAITMASPAPSTDSTDSASAAKKEDITFKFCRECSNMLYPKEDRMTNQLMFACRTCQFSEPAKASCVFRNHMYNTVGETAGVTQDVGSDPTVGGPLSESEEFATSGVVGSDVEEFCCTLCGREIEWCCPHCGEEVEFCELKVGPGGVVDARGDGLEGVGNKVQGLTLEEMSRMEEDDEDMDGEEDTTGGEFLHEGEGDGDRGE